ncbi:helix-turn-helix domain-containing protein [Alteromonas sp. P256]|uniref:helix-turn-helix domain-containing protein n=1 Tax=Alteromonas sp. P256 TaxID=3117399 RepID=UPI002FE0A47B
MVLTPLADITPPFWSHVIKALLTAYRDHGIDDELRIKEMTELAAQIEQRTLCYQDFIHRLNNALVLIKRDDLIWLLPNYIQANQLDLLFLKMLAAKNLKQGLNDLLKFKTLIFFKQVELKVVVKEGFVSIGLIYVGCEPEDCLQRYLDFSVMLLFYICRAILGQKFKVESVIFPVSHPSVDEKMIENTQTSVLFKGDKYLIIFDSDLLTTPSFFYNPTLRKRLRQLVEQQLISTKLYQQLSEQVLAFINQADLPAQVTFAEVCNALGISESQARRKLREENNSFKKISNWWFYQAAVSELISTNKKIEVIALELGYSERASFDRAFKALLGTSAAQFREFGKRFGYQRSTDFFTDTVDNLPPIPESCQSILQLKTEELNIPKAVAIIEKDPIFSGRILGLASKATFGSPPTSVRDAIGRTLGIERVKSLSAVFLAKDQLGELVVNLDVDKLIRAIMLAPWLHLKIRKKIFCDYDSTLDEQVLLLGLLGMLLVFHKADMLNAQTSQVFNRSADFFQFMRELNTQCKVSLFSTSAILLAAWGLSDKLVKTLSGLDVQIQENSFIDNRQASLVLALSMAMTAAFEHFTEPEQLVSVTSLLERETLEMLLEEARNQLKAV